MMGRGVASFLAFGMVALVGLSGCASTTTRVYIDAPDNANDGATFYMMIRKADDSLSTETYQEAAAHLFEKDPDGKLVLSQVIIPGEKMTVTVPDAESSDIGVYFFFTDPDGDFRVPLKKPLPAEIFIDLGQHQVSRVRIRRR